MYGFHILDVMEPIYDYFRKLQDLNEEYEDYLEEFFKIKENEIEKIMGKLMHEPLGEEKRLVIGWYTGDYYSGSVELPFEVFLLKKRIKLMNGRNILLSLHRYNDTEMKS